ncbi:hypothetical protein CIB84_014707 [Bambusicola thoracicus]|uniref:Polycystin cation channel PKD1/PKD2 domain-containing protein n=1 Tax=Bambusicola thoracicus TaxID=9083 RepID=A0A2P4SBR0_BAMTH|nr:hypothetical protein CIB84_014707 [Bambusicola thoracicus]
MNEEEMQEKHFRLAQVRDTKLYKPLEDGEIAKMLETAKIKVKAFVFIKDVIGHLAVLALVLYFAYSTENTNSFHYNQFIRNQFSPRLSAVVKLEDIYMWVNNTFLPLIHNDVQPTFLTDSSSKIIGLPRMRQVRAKDTEKKCFYPHSFVNKFVINKSHCLHKYGRDTEEKGDYAGTWTKVANCSFSKDPSSRHGFTYEPNRTPWTYFSYGDLHTYGPGGYTFYFFPEEGRHNSTVTKFKMGADIVHFFLLYPNDFIPFHAVSHLDQNLRNTLGFLSFLAILKTLKYSQLFYEVRLAQRSILAALSGISSMTFVVVVYFLIFMAVGYLMFGQHERNYNTMILSAQTIFSYCVSAFRDTEFSCSRLLGGFFLASFLLVMTSILINIFQAVILSAYGDRKQLVCEEPSDEARVVAFVLQRMKKMLCFLTCRTAKRSDPDLCHSVHNGQAERRLQ